MTDASQQSDGSHDEEVPSDAELEEPSTEKQPEEAPKTDAPAEPEPEPSHEAIGIGVIGGEPLEPVEPEQPPTDS